MTLSLSFLAIGNADCIIAVPESGAAVMIDIGDAVRAEQWLQAEHVTMVSVVYLTHEHADHVPSLEKLDAFLERCIAASCPIQCIRVPPGLMPLWKKRIQDADDCHVKADGRPRVRQQMCSRRLVGLCGFVAPGADGAVSAHRFIIA